MKVGLLKGAWMGKGVGRCLEEGKNEKFVSEGMCAQ